MALKGAIRADLYEAIARKNEATANITLYNPGITVEHFKNRMSILCSNTVIFSKNLSKMRNFIEPMYIENRLVKN